MENFVGCVHSPGVYTQTQEDIFFCFLGKVHVPVQKKIAAPTCGSDASVYIHHLISILRAGIVLEGEPVSSHQSNANHSKSSSSSEAVPVPRQEALRFRHCALNALLLYQDSAEACELLVQILGRKNGVQLLVQALHVPDPDTCFFSGVLLEVMAGT